MHRYTAPTNKFRSTTAAQLAWTNPATDPIAFPALLTLPRPLRGPAVRIEAGLIGPFSFDVVGESASRSTDSEAVSLSFGGSGMVGAAGFEPGDGSVTGFVDTSGADLLGDFSGIGGVEV